MAQKRINSVGQANRALGFTPARQLAGNQAAAGAGGQAWTIEEEYTGIFYIYNVPLRKYLGYTRNGANFTPVFSDLRQVWNVVRLPNGNYRFQVYNTDAILSLDGNAVGTSPTIRAPAANNEEWQIDNYD